MSRETEFPDYDPELNDTARIPRSRTVLAQIEAALLADKLSVEDVSHKATGTDPYNTGVYKNPATSGIWKGRPR
jgi:hypothetical protein